MTFKGADKIRVRRFGPIRFDARSNFVELGKEPGQKFLDGFFNFRARNVVPIVKIKPQIPIRYPPFQDG